MEGYLRVGTIHSHCDFGAFHSGTDINDEADFDGLHVTFGHNNRDIFTISASIVVNNIRKSVEPMDFIEGVEKKEVGVRGGVYLNLGRTDKTINAHKSKDTWVQLGQIHGKNFL